MKKTLWYFLYACVSINAVLIPGNTVAQTLTPGTIKVRKDKPFLFFQVGAATDTVSATKGNVYYISFPDSLKDRLTINVFNGQMLLKNDTLLELRYLGGLKYEGFYEGKEKWEGKKPVKSWEFKLRINGTTDYEAGKILIQITDRMKVVLENKLYYKNQLR